MPGDTLPGLISTLLLLCNISGDFFTLVWVFGGDVYSGLSGL